MIAVSLSLFGSLLVQASLFFGSVWSDIDGYFRPGIEGYALARYCRELGKEKKVLSIWILMQLKYTNWEELNAAYTAALPPERAVEFLVKMSQQDKLDWYFAIRGLSAHRSITTNNYLCAIVMHSGNEDVRLAGYIAAREGKNGLLFILAVIDYLQLRSIPVRTTYPYCYRDRIIFSYIAKVWPDLTVQDFLLPALCALLPPQQYCPKP
jgi:hypothetical protein